ncbi:phage baseplate assembly protein V, partial [Escherichia coli]|nr:phage baseplate assembly protein V [Escherichia coli]
AGYCCHAAGFSAASHLRGRAETDCRLRRLSSAAVPAIYSNQFAPPSTSANACVTEHPDGGWFEYEPAT